MSYHVATHKADDIVVRDGTVTALGVTRHLAKPPAMPVIGKDFWVVVRSPWGPSQFNLGRVVGFPRCAARTCPTHCQAQAGQARQATVQVRTPHWHYRSGHAGRSPAGRNLPSLMAACLSARAVTLALRHKFEGAEERTYTVICPSGWSKSTFLKYVRRYHPHETARIVEWPQPSQWLVNPDGYENYRTGTGWTE